jgi:hypothetical protein
MPALELCLVCQRQSVRYADSSPSPPAAQLAAASSRGAAPAPAPSASAAVRTRPCPAVRLRGNGGNDAEKQGIRNHDTEQHCPRQPVGIILLLCAMEERLARLETLVEQ